MKFWSKKWNFGQKMKFWSKKWNFGQKIKFWSKNEILIKKMKFWSKKILSTNFFADEFKMLQINIKIPKKIFIGQNLLQKNSGARFGSHPGKPTPGLSRRWKIGVGPRHSPATIRPRFIRSDRTAALRSAASNRFIVRRFRRVGRLWRRRRFLEGPNFCTIFDRVNNFFKWRASYHFKG